MKKLYLQSLFIAIFALYSVSSSAEGRWITSAKVVKIVATNNGGINVRLSPEIEGCTVNSQSGYGLLYASLWPDHPGKDKITAIFLAAYMADKPVAIWLSDKETCKIGEVELGGR
jgi:hypothetical protein